MNYKCEANQESANKFLNHDDEIGNKPSANFHPAELNFYDEFISNFDRTFDEQNKAEQINALDIYFKYHSTHNFIPNSEILTNLFLQSVSKITNILNYRDQYSYLILQCFDILEQLFVLQGNDPLILLNFQILGLMHQYLINPKIEDIIPVLKMIYFLTKSQYNRRVFDHYQSSIFYGILKKFSTNSGIQLLTTKILINFTKVFSQLDISLKQNQSNEMLNATIFLFSQLHNKTNIEYMILNCSLVLLKKLIQDSLPDLQSSSISIDKSDLPDNPTHQMISIIDYLNFLQETVNKVITIETVLKILKEIILKDISFYFKINISRIFILTKAQNANVQSHAIRFFYTLLQVIDEHNNENLTKHEIELHNEKENAVFQEIINHILDLRLYVRLLELMKDENYYFSKVAAIQAMDILFHYIPNNIILETFDEEIIMNLCYIIESKAKFHELVSSLSLLQKIIEFGQATEQVQFISMAQEYLSIERICQLKDSSKISKICYLAKSLYEELNAYDNL
ncbi:hypothetical protein TRFO_34790 [Tritrichomonas foetus]|uniref:Uncharacterized protein n=1 Tax=Tritrichomonas foetus TaxID=1144522 RepID=A0A1J4JNP2_9EUKA|nr:hypothetical protein TRFO_34790 [Tritrichomonas foetus]|eukprot:OHS98884.1 hypothetical protein TRFO_34790 [Tritrichomonas foetus]